MTTGPNPEIGIVGLEFGRGDVLAADVLGPTSTRAQLYWRAPDGAFADKESRSVTIASGATYLAVNLTGIPPGSVLQLEPSDTAGFTLSNLRLIQTGG